jgi:hypothetical protein
MRARDGLFRSQRFSNDDTVEQSLRHLVLPYYCGATLAHVLRALQRIIERCARRDCYARHSLRKAVSISKFSGGLVLKHNTYFDGR